VKFDCSTTILNNPERFNRLMVKFEESVEKGVCSKEMLELLKRKPKAFADNPSLLEKALIIGPNKRLIPFLFCHADRIEFHGKCCINISVHDRNVFERSCLSKITRPTQLMGHALTSSSTQETSVGASNDRRLKTCSSTDFPIKGPPPLQCVSAAKKQIEG
jgi:hypothetical protein